MYAFFSFVAWLKLSIETVLLWHATAGIETLHYFFMYTCKPPVSFGAQQNIIWPDVHISTVIHSVMNFKCENGLIQA